VLDSYHHGQGYGLFKFGGVVMGGVMVAEGMGVRGERPPHPGLILKERFLDPLGISPVDLAAHIGVSPRQVRAIVRGRRGISTETAVRLGLFFGVPPAWWLDMQSRYDTEGAPLVEELREQAHPYEDMENVLVCPTGVRFSLPPPKRQPGPILMSVPEELEKRLRAQAALGKSHPPRKVRMVTYENGAVALVGSDD
jgi:addiction module HigA family antidote